MSIQTKLNKIGLFLDRFFKQVETTNTNPDPAEYIDGQAFQYRTYELATPQYVTSNDTLTASIHNADGTVTSYSEPVNQTGVIDGISIFRSKEAFGMTEVVGAAFGKLTEPQK